MTETEVESLRGALVQAGFDEVRFAEVSSVFSGDFEAWLAAGHHADMAWLERGREKRRDAQAVLAGAASVIVLGVNYLPADAAARQQRWAKYALFTDYHDTIKVGLQAAVRILESRLGLTRDDTRVYVDTGPVLERGWASRAGLGFQGKNAMLISRQHGNWLFLATILVRAAIPPDAPLAKRRSERREGGAQVADDLRKARPEVALHHRPPSPAAALVPEVGLYCGSCTRCLEACPTAAFPKPGWVDARRCISYHTIENRGVIPRELRARFGGRIFGCDTCLDVCPWNRFAQAGRSALLSARGEIAMLTLLDLLAMTEEPFRTWFRGTPMKRTKLTGLLRNACIAAGNWDDGDDWHFGAGVARAQVVAGVEVLCAHASDVVRVHAVWALFRLLGQAGGWARTAALRAAETSVIVREEYAAWEMHEQENEQE